MAAVIQDRCFHDGDTEAEKLVVEVLRGGAVAILGAGVVGIIEEGFEGPRLVGKRVFEGGGEGVGEVIGGRERDGETGGVDFVSGLSAVDGEVSLVSLS